MHVCNACVLCNTNTRLTLLIRANNKNSERCMTARSAILVQCANGTLHTAELGFFPLQSRAHRLHEVIGTQHHIQYKYGTGVTYLRVSGGELYRGSLYVDRTTTRAKQMGVNSWMDVMVPFRIAYNRRFIIIA